MADRKWGAFEARLREKNLPPVRASWYAATTCKSEFPAVSRSFLTLE
jgi:hypothetical protein